ncbi:MAG TPA: hypothetical protein VHZ04_00115 [Candidatus Paceibacterota bacterium]|jgi:hypothetical protein|nr:hypothetical protein [Candidatus Paceibacterota bacterium]
MEPQKPRRARPALILTLCIVIVCAATALIMANYNPRVFVVSEGGATSTRNGAGGTDPGKTGDPSGTASPTPLPPLNTAAYNAKMLQIANLPIITKTAVVTSSITNASTGITSVIRKSVVTTSTAANGWPVATAPYPDAGALLPFNRIVAYYGNFYSTQMGILGEYPPDQVLAMLASTTAMWQAADPTTHVIPALDYIAVAAQATAGTDGKYRLRMPASQVDQAISMANQINGLVFLDIQVGLSNVETEVPLLAQYLQLPNVELSLDPEFAMHDGERPGTVIGTLDATDINFAAQFLAGIVKQYNLPPKILVVHRFTQDMVTNYKEIAPLPQVQIVMDMDGFGPPAQKVSTYEDFIASEPVQFTGFKLFYKNDIRVAGSHLMTPAEVLSLSPEPSYIQYQ